jgi:hypothetical protein
MLNAGMYPHLVDEIFSFAPHPSLLRLRAASKTFRKKADQWLVAGRLIVTRAPNLVIASDRGRVPAFADLALGTPPIPDDDDDDDDDYSVPFPDNFNTVPFPDVDLGRTRIVDFVGLNILLGRVPGRDNGFVPPFTALHRPHITARYFYELSDTRPDRAIQFGSTEVNPSTGETVVGFCTLPNLWRYPEDPFAPLRTPPPPAERDCARRAVFNIAFHPGDTFRFCVLLAPYCLKDVDEVVWVFHRANAPTTYCIQPEPLAPGWKTTDRAYTNYLAGDLLEGVIYCIGQLLFDSSHCRAVTVVGLESLEGKWRRAPSDEWGSRDPDMVRRFLLLGHFARIWDLRDPLDPDHLVVPSPDAEGCVHLNAYWEQSATLKIITLAGFRQQLGPERAGIETMESGWIE